MKKYFTIPLNALFFITLTAMQTPVYGWANGEGSCYAQGNMLGSAALSFHHFGLNVAFDYGLHDCISLGAIVGYDGYSRLDVRYNHVPLMVRGAFHPFNLAALADKIVIRDMIDVYVGISTGVLFVGIKKDDYVLYDDREKTGYKIREYIGMRYWASGKWGFFIEDCGWASNIAIGATYKF